MMNCAEFEILLADYMDGTLPGADRAAVEEHAASCACCQDLLKEVGSAVNFLAKAQDVTPPPELITRIAYYAPMGRWRQPFERQSILAKIMTRWLQPFLQPRFAMGMAMTILSFAMLERCTGVRIQHVQTADLNPVRIWGGLEDRTVRVKDRAVKYYENLRWVYGIEVTLRELRDQQDAAATQNSNPAEQPSGSSGKGKGTNTPDKGNSR